MRRESAPIGARVRIGPGRGSPPDCPSSVEIQAPDLIQALIDPILTLDLYGYDGGSPK